MPERQILIVVFSLLLTTVAGCKKDLPRFCWQRVDNFGNNLELICNKTETQIKALYPNPCSYYKAEGEEFCALVNGSFMRNLTQHKLDYLSRCFGISGMVTRINCDYCGRWYHREKRTYKPANTITFSSVRIEQFCGDTAKTLYQGRQVVKKDTPDSLIVVQFSSDGASW